MPIDHTAILPTVTTPGKSLNVRLATVSRCLVILTTIAIAAVSYVASDLLTTIALSLLLSLLLSPVVTALERLHLPRQLASGLVVVLAVACAVLATVALTQPMKDWVDKAPAAVQTVKARIQKVEGSFSNVTRSAESLGSLGGSSTSGKTGQASVPVAVPNMIHDILAATPHVLATLVSVILLMYFFLSSGDNFLRRLVEVAPGMSEKRTVVTIARDIQREMSRYLLTITLINIGLGVATVIACAALRVPNALLWGAMACLLNFAPYVGSAITLMVLGIVGLTSFESAAHALAVPAAFLLIASIEGQLVTPTVIGRRLSVNPVVVFVWLLAWGSLWGISGLLLAGPLLACFRIVCQHTAALRPIYVLIGEAKSEVDS